MNCIETNLWKKLSGKQGAGAVTRTGDNLCYFNRKTTHFVEAL